MILLSWTRMSLQRSKGLPLPPLEGGWITSHYFKYKKFRELPTNPLLRGKEEAFIHGSPLLSTATMSLFCRQNNFVFLQ